MIPLCERNGIAQIVWSPLAQGVLTGKYRPGEKAPADSRAANRSMNRFIKQWLKDDMLRPSSGCARSPMRPASRMSQLALAWVLRQPNVTSVIIGARRPEQVRDNAAAAGVQLTDDTLAAIDDALENSGGVVSSGSIRQPPPAAPVACQSSSNSSSGVGGWSARAVAATRPGGMPARANASPASASTR